MLFEKKEDTNDLFVSNLDQKKINKNVYNFD